MPPTGVSPKQPEPVPEPPQAPRAPVASPKPAAPKAPSSVPSAPAKEPPSKPATPRKTPKSEPKVPVAEPPAPKKPEPTQPTIPSKAPNKPTPAVTTKEPPIPQPKNPPAPVSEPGIPAAEPPAPKKLAPTPAPEPKPVEPVSSAKTPKPEPKAPPRESTIPRKPEPAPSAVEKSKIPSSWKVNADPTVVRGRIERQFGQAEKPSQIPPLSKEQFDQLKKNGLVSGNTKNTQSITVALNGEEWILGGRNSRILLQNKNDPSISVLIPNYYEANQNNLRAYAEKATEYRASERKDEAGMKTFDIADNKEPVGFIELFDGTDRITNSIKGMPEMLSRRYNLQMAPGSRIDGSAVQSPIQALKSQIQKMHDAGIRNFYINISAHGGTDEIAFGKKGSLNAKDLVELTVQFGDSKFTSNITSCYGGGIGEAMSNFRDHSKAEKGRVTMFTQTKEDVGNGATPVNQDGYSTAYNIAIARYLMQGVDGNPGQKLSYGEAHLKADQFAKGTSQYDAEVRSSSPGKNSNYTADTGSRATEGQV